MSRYITVTMDQRQVSCTAIMLDKSAPQTCEAIWNALPLGGSISHAVYARNEVYTLVRPFAEKEPVLENPTITPIPGDLCYFSFPTNHFAPEFRQAKGIDDLDFVVDLALFYGRNNLLLNADTGFVPGTVFGSVVDGLDEMAIACRDVLYRGTIGECLSFSRYEDV